MDDSSRMRMFEGRASLDGPANRLGDGNLPAPGELNQVRSSHEVHHKEIGSAHCPTQTLHADDIRVPEPRQDSRFFDEPFNKVRLTKKRFAKELHRDSSIRAVLPCLVDLSHTP